MANIRQFWPVLLSFSVPQGTSVPLINLLISYKSTFVSWFAKLECVCLAPKRCLFAAWRRVCSWTLVVASPIMLVLEHLFICWCWWNQNTSSCFLCFALIAFFLRRMELPPTWRHFSLARRNQYKKHHIKSHLVTKGCHHSIAMHLREIKLSGQIEFLGEIG